MTNPNPKELMVVRATLGGHAIREDIAEHAAIVGDLDAVNAAIADNPGRYAWWATLETLAARAESDAKDALDALEADLLDKARGVHDTVTAAKAAMKTNLEWKKLNAAWRESQSQHALIRVGKTTMEKREAALKNLSENLRGEMEYDLNIRQRVAGMGGTVEQAEAAMQRWFGKKTTRGGR